MTTLMFQEMNMNANELTDVQTLRANVPVSMSSKVR
ncbi:ferritin Dps family protein [Pseudomonas putida S11]|nr:ferritin Dps family protein [Pseudomonas putida S11]